MDALGEERLAHVFVAVDEVHHLVVAGVAERLLVDALAQRRLVDDAGEAAPEVVEGGLQLDVVHALEVSAEDRIGGVEELPELLRDRVGDAVLEGLVLEARAQALRGRERIDARFDPLDPVLDFEDLAAKLGRKALRRAVLGADLTDDRARGEDRAHAGEVERRAHDREAGHHSGLRNPAGLVDEREAHLRDLEPARTEAPVHLAVRERDARRGGRAETEGAEVRDRQLAVTDPQREPRGRVAILPDDGLAERRLRLGLEFRVCSHRLARTHRLDPPDGGRAQRWARVKIDPRCRTRAHNGGARKEASPGAQTTETAGARVDREAPTLE